ncbi:MAG: type II toxin-antitoxin system HicB family antitoxin [Deltaproteobacteria bacterium]|nr:type II toxin-antitoxin system HicB family antitoxin [Deltaproteobacteria bacterium]
MERVFEATIEKRGRWWVGWVDAVPGANSQGRTLREVQENLKEAVALVLEASKELRAEKPVRRYKRKLLVNV